MSKEFKRKEHSDIIVHWTGRDIDANDPEMQKTLPVNWRKHCLRQIEQPSLIKDSKIIEDYVNRLRDILKFGLWLTKDKLPEEIQKTPSCSDDDGRINETPDITRVCFTELKLSESRQHAYEYGRLGIGLKRMFLFNRAGHPLFYISPKKGYTKPNWFSHLINNSQNDTVSNAQKSYFKYMSETEDLNYKYYSESEWRIVCPHNLDEDNAVLNSIRKYFINVAGNINDEIKKYSGINQVQIKQTELEEFIKKNQNKSLKFLIPLDYWLAIIIYPCPAVKIAAECDPEIRNLLSATRSKKIDSLDYNKLAEISKEVGEEYMMPMEIDLDTISHF